MPALTGANAIAMTMNNKDNKETQWEKPMVNGWSAGAILS
jgi:hypothetical protein